MEPNNKQLFVGNLPYSVGWQDLKDLFREYGEVVRSDVVMSNNRSRGFGTVLFSNAEEAQSAISQLNNYEWNGRRIEVRLDRPKQQNSEENRLFVGNLPFSLGWQDLKDLFREAGSVIRADIQNDYQGRSKGYGIVIMETFDDAQNAIAMYNGKQIMNRTIEVREDALPQHRPSPPRQQQQRYNSPPRGGDENSNNGDSSPAPPESGTQLFIGNLPFSVGWQDLKDLFREAGSVVRADVPSDSNGRSRGYGQVTMATSQEASAAIERFNQTDFNGREIEVRFDKFSDGGSAKGTQVFVGNLPYQTRWQELKDIFRPIGLNPVHADILLDGTGRSKGCGVVRFLTAADADKAVAEMNGHSLDGRNITVKLDQYQK